MQSKRTLSTHLEGGTMGNRIATVLLVAAGLSAAATHNDASLSVTTTPPGLQVWLNDKYMGDSPLTNRKLSPGNYTLRLVDPAQRTSASEGIALAAGEPVLIERTVSREFGSLAVQTQPAGAKVRVAAELGETPLSNGFMTPGSYVLEIRHLSGFYKPLVEEVTIRQGETVALTRKLHVDNPFDTKAVVRLFLGAGAAAAFVWAIIEQGQYSAKLEQARQETGADAARLQEEGRTASSLRNLAIILGGVCTLGFEIVAFF